MVVFMNLCPTDKKKNQEIGNMKVRSSVKRRCEYCQVIKRNGTLRIVCSRNARHKQRQG